MKEMIKKKQEKLIVPEGTDEVISIYDIRIPPDFSKTPPQHVKIVRACTFIHNHGVIDKPLSVIAETNEKGHMNRFILIDGYSRYLALLYNGIKRVPVKYIDINDLDLIQ
jgi:ParB-like chromosome segregation protein Spo0J